jgi:peptide/nickel transport system substrate-binding protein
MNRREFLKSASVTAIAAGAGITAPAMFTSARAQSRQETILVVTGPNNFDIHGVGTNRPGYEVSWNCYDR